MVFTLDDVSQLVGREGQRLGLLQSLATGVRAPAANLRAAAENLAAFRTCRPTGARSSSTSRWPNRAC
jgi:hypothetical protein